MRGDGWAEVEMMDVQKLETTGTERELVKAQ